MFPYFRVVSDGLNSTMDTFISNESFYSSEWGASGVPQAPQTAGTETWLPGYMGTEQAEPSSCETVDEAPVAE